MPNSSKADTGHVPADEKEACLDRAFAYCAINVALRRHAGFYAQENDPVMGIMAGTAIGRDLRDVHKVLCAGGVVVRGDQQKMQAPAARCCRRSRYVSSSGTGPADYHRQKLHSVCDGCSGKTLSRRRSQLHEKYVSLRNIKILRKAEQKLG